MKILYAKDFNRVLDFLTINLDGVTVAFSTAESDRSFNRHRDYGVNNLNSIVKDFNINNVIYLNQIHSDEVFVYRNNFKNITEKEGDALITSEKECAIGVFTADCVPIIIVDDKNKVIAAIHSGWKGTYNSIVTRTLEKMTEEFNIDIDKTKIFIGPHIRQCCYEVSEELKEKFIDKTKIDREILFKGRNLSLEECILKDVREFGIKEDNIYSLDLCTHCEEGIKLFSYRKSVGTYGRLFSFAFVK